MKPKILVVDIGGWGGIAHYTYNLMKAVARNASVDSALLTDSQYELDGLQRNFQVIKKPLRDQPYGAALRSVLEAVREYAPDAVHVQTMISARRDWIWFLLAALRRFPVIVTAHNILPHDEPEQRALFMKTAFRVIYRSASGIIVHSEYAKERLKEFAGASGMRIAVIPHGNYLFFKTRPIPQAQARQRLGIAARAPVLLYFGALRHYKGIEDVLDIFSSVLPRHPDAVLLLAGKSMYGAPGYFKACIEERGLAGRVVFHDNYIKFDEIQNYYYACDAVVLPYRHIDTSGAIQLAYAFGKPVVVSRTGSMPETVEDGVNGMLVAPGDIHGFSGAISAIFSDKGLAERMGQASLKLAQDRFSWERIAELTCSLYREVTGE